MNIRKMGLSNGQFIWIEDNIGYKWAQLVLALDNEAQWDLWDELRLSPVTKAWNAAKRVRELHAKCDCDMGEPMCHECDFEWPCQTIRALDGEQQ